MTPDDVTGIKWLKKHNNVCPAYFPPHRPYAGIFFLFVLFSFLVRETACIFFVFCPCYSSSYLVRACHVRATGILFRMLFFLQPFLSLPIFLRHILQNTCRWFRFVFFILFFFFLFLTSVFFVVWLVLLRSRTRYASISFDLP